ncbi:MAG: SDR family oxidoreductase [Myxococcales bacterium]|nr:SDR family oxidoreductase [Myxococcales bacterium]
MTRQLEDRVALVTGGGTGIGAAIAKRLAEEGARVVICGRRAELLEAVVEAIRKAGGEAHAVPTDLIDPENVTALVEDTAARHGSLDVLVNNAVQMVIKPVLDMSVDEWRKSLGVGLEAVFVAVKAALPIMAATGRGAIVNISSLAAHMSEAGLGGYSAAKAGLESFTRAAAIEAAADGVRVNSLCLGMIATEQGDVAFDAEARAAMESIIPLGRFGKPREIANCALFLVSDQATFVTGTTLIADGGQSASLGSPELRTGHRQ